MIKKQKITYSNPLKPSGKTLFCYLSIPVAVYIFMVILPVAMATVYGFFDWSGGASMKFVGLSNYLKVFSDRVFKISFKNTIIFTVAMMVGQVGIAFILTLLFTMPWMKFVEAHRRVMFFPNMIAAVVIGLMWQIIYNREYGLLNQVLRWLGRSDWIQLWLDDPKVVMLYTCIPVIWQYVGYYLVLLMGAVATIPRDIMEMAQIDGANGWQRCIYITIPMIWDTLKICLMMCLSGSFKGFDHILVMTAGGPGRSTTVLSLYNYEMSFKQMKLGYACAMAVIIMVVSFGLTIGLRKLMTRRSMDD